MNEYGLTDEQNEGDWLKKLRKQAKEVPNLLSENEALKERLSKLESQSQARDLKSVFAQRGVNPAFIKFYAGDTSDESIDAWIAENEELLGLRKPDVDEGSDPSVISVSDQEAWTHLRGMVNDRKLVLDMQSRLEAATDKDEVMAIIAEARGLGLPDM